jgi:hypothetical protein
LGVRSIIVGGRAEGDQVMSNVVAAVTTEVLQAFADAWNRHDADTSIQMDNVSY